MNDLRAVFPIHISRGALLRSDGAAVGLVSGGAPSWDLMAAAARVRIGADYHRLLLALDAPLDLYLIDQPPDVTEALVTLRERQLQAVHPLHSEILGELADYLTMLAQQSSSRAKQAIWVITVPPAPGSRGVAVRDLHSLLARSSHSAAAGLTPASLSALARAVELARRLAGALRVLESTPAPRLLEAEEIARLLYTLADPVRAQRYPLEDTLLDRVRRVVTLHSCALPDQQTGDEGHG